MAVSHKEEIINATLTMNDHPVRFQLDSAADVNTICQKLVREHHVSPCNYSTSEHEEQN